MESNTQVLKGGFHFFDKKSLVKSWNPDISVHKEDVKTVPMWVQLAGLDYLYWGEKSVYKMVGFIGEPVKMDQATKKQGQIAEIE